MKPFDLQANGYGGVDFNTTCTVSDIHKACQLLDQHGVGGILATIITDGLENMSNRLSAIAKAREESPLAKQIIHGVHIEGPFINSTSGYVGAHPKEHTRAATVENMKKLIEAAQGLTKLVTLAPENDLNLATTQWLAEQNIVVSAGHCNHRLRNSRRQSTRD